MGDTICDCGHPRSVCVGKKRECSAPAARDPVNAPATKRDDGKDRWDLLPVGSVRVIVRVLTWSASKDNPNRYPEGNWQQVERPRERYYAAAMRHLTAWFDGELADPDSGLPHLAHACSSLLFLLWFEGRK